MTMEPFDPTRHIHGAESILDAERQWPEFHDAEVHSLRFWRGDRRPDGNVWIGSVIDTSLELVALEVPFLVDLRFHDCVDIEMSGFNHQNAIMSLSFEFESRGFLTDGTTPLLPYIRVQFEGAWGVSLAFRCFRVEVLGRREVSGQPHA